MRRWLTIAALVAIVTAILAGWLFGTASGLRFAVEQLGKRLPATIAYRDLDGRLLGRILAKQFNWEGAGYSVSAEDIELDWSAAGILARAIRIDTLRAAGVTVRQLPADDDVGTDPPAGPPQFTVDLTSAEIYAFRWIGRDGSAGALNRIELAATYRNGDISVQRARLDRDDANVDLSGRIFVQTPFPFAADVEWRFDNGVAPAVAGRSLIEGDRDRQNTSTTLTEPFAASIEIDLIGTPNGRTWDARVDAKSVTPSQFAESLPAGSADIRIVARGTADEVDGSAEVDWPALYPDPLRLRVDAVREDNLIRAREAVLSPADSPTSVRLTGTYQLDDRAIDTDVNWASLQWPLHGEPTVTSREGSASISGLPGQFRVDSKLALTEKTIGDASLTTRLDVTGKTLRIEALAAELLGGKVTGTGNADWQQTPLLSLDVQASHLDTASLPGGVASDLSFDGRLDLVGGAEKPGFAIRVTDLRGELDGHVVTGALAANGSGGEIDLTELDLNQGPNTLQASGHIGANSNLAFALDAPALEAVHGALSGSLAARGRLTGSLTAPRLVAEAEGTDTRIGDYASKTLTANADLDLLQPATGALRLRATAVSAAEADLGNLELDLAPSANRQRLTATLSGGPWELSLALDGSSDNGRWQGQLETVTLGRSGDEPWTNDAPVAFSADDQSARLARSLCLRRHQSSACVEGRWHAREEWVAHWSLRNLALGTLQPYLELIGEDDLRFGGVLSGQGRLFAPPGSRWQADGSLYVEGGSIFQLGVAGAYDQIAFVGASGDFRVEQDITAAGLRIDFGHDDFTQAILETPRAAAGGISTTPLSGKLTVRFADLSRAPLHFREFSRLEGSLRIDAALGGTRAEPTLRGRGMLENASAELTGLGALLEEIAVTADADLKGLDLDATARSGDGRLALSGHLDWVDDGVAGTLKLTGENANAVNVPEARVNVSPDIEIRLSPEAVGVSGGLDIPFARIRPLTIATARRPSVDTVIIGEAADATTRRRRGTDLDIDVTLGDDVRFDGFGLAAMLAGSLNVSNPQGITIGTGEVRVRKGTYAIGSARLNIDSGLLLYAGGPINNPGLSVRAVRQMQTVLVGVSVSGTLRRPTISLFSNPPMREADIISYLAFSRPSSTLDAEEGEQVDQTSGALAAASAGLAMSDVSDRLGLDEIAIRSEGREDDSQLVLGRFITPRIYLSYGFGLFEPINTLRLRLNITERLILLTESGVEDSADIFYTWDR